MSWEEICKEVLGQICFITKVFTYNKFSILLTCTILIVKNLHKPKMQIS